MIENSRCVGGGVQVCAANVSGVADGRGESNGDGALGLGSRNGGRHPGEDELEDGKGPDGLEEHGLQQRRVKMPPSEKEFSDTKLGDPQARLEGLKIAKTYKVSRSEVVRGRGENLTDDGDTTARDDVEAALAGPAAVPRVEDGIDARGKVRRCGEEERLHAGIPEGLDDGWEEICIFVRSVCSVLFIVSSPPSFLPPLYLSFFFPCLACM